MVTHWIKLSISFRFPDLVECKFLKYVATILWIPLASVVISPCLFLVFINLDISLCLLSSYNKGLSILLVFLTKTCYFIDSLYYSLIHLSLIHMFLLYIAILSLIISCCLLFLCVTNSIYSRAFRCIVKSLVWGLSTLFMSVFSAINFPLSTAFICSISLGMLHIYFHWLLEICNFILIYFSFGRGLISFHEFVNSLLFVTVDIQL